MTQALFPWIAINYPMYNTMKNIWPFSFYFLFFAASASLVPYLALYYKNLGLSGGQIGLLTGLSPILILVGAPFWTSLADTTHHQKLVLRVSIAGAVVIALIYPSAKTFGHLIPLVVLFAFISSPIISIADDATMFMLSNKRGTYGRIRLGGSIGWGVAAPIAGMLIEKSNIFWSFWLYALCMIGTLIVSSKFRFVTTYAKTSFSHGVHTILGNRQWLFFLGRVFISGMGIATINTYLYVYLDEIGASNILMGLALMIASLAELPIMFFSNRLIQYLKPYGLLKLSMFIIGLRLLLCATFPFPFAILFIQILNGLTFPAIWVAGVSFANENAPKGMSATTQGLFSATMIGIGAGVGSLLGGLLYEVYGGSSMYLFLGLLVLLALIFFTLLEKFFPLDTHEKGI